MKKTLEIEIGSDRNLWKITPLSEKSFTGRDCWGKHTGYPNFKEAS